MLEPREFDDRQRTLRTTLFPNFPKLRTFQDILSLYPDLTSLDIEPRASLKKVNKFVAQEISCKFSELDFADGNKVSLEMSMWYLSVSAALSRLVIPVIIILKNFLYLIKNIDCLYSSLPRENIVDLEILKTKTDFAYEHFTLS
jgi:hypothetical protein